MNSSTVAGTGEIISSVQGALSKIFSVAFFVVSSSTMLVIHQQSLKNIDAQINQSIRRKLLEPFRLIDCLNLILVAVNKGKCCHIPIRQFIY